MKILVADKFEQSGLEGLKSLGCSVVYDPSLKDDALVDAIRTHNHEVLVVRSTQVTAPMLESGDLSLVIRAGAGVNTIDVDTASRRGIYVANCRQKRHRRRRVGVWADFVARSAYPRQCGAAAGGSVEQEGVQRGARGVRLHAGANRRGQHRARDDYARGRSECVSSRGAVR